MPGPLSTNYTQQNDKESCLCGGCGCIFGEDIKLLIFLEDSICFVLSHRRWEFLFLAPGASTQEGLGSSIPCELLAEPWAARVGETLQRAFSSLFPVSSFSSPFFYSFLFCLFNSENCLNRVEVHRTLQQLHLQPLHRRETPRSATLAPPLLSHPIPRLIWSKLIISRHLMKVCQNYFLKCSNNSSTTSN